MDNDVRIEAVFVELAAPGEIIIGDASDEFLAGGDNDDTILGAGGADTIEGRGGNDELSGNQGNDSVLGGEGNDSIFGGDGDDTVVGGAGDDELSGNLGRDTIFGDGGDDTILAGGGDDIAQGGDGRDRLDGGAGADTVDYSDSILDVHIDLANELATFPETSMREFIFSFENAIGGEGDDTLIGTAGGNRLDGGPGNDSLLGGEGDDTLVGDPGNDTLDGGPGDDTADYSGTDTGAVFDLEAGTVVLPDGTTDELVSIENIVATQGDDTVIGSENGEFIDGQGGNDVLSGNGGNDTVLGGAGDDSIVGGLGDGDEGSDGDDVYDGGDGNDTLSFETTTEGVTVDLGDERASGPEIGDDIVTGIENVFGGSGDDTIAGDSGDNVLCGNDGDDRIDGADGDDTLIGGGGNDTIDGGGGNDLIYGDSAAGIGDVELTIRFAGESADYSSTYGWYNSATLEARVIVADTNVQTNPTLAHFVTGLRLTADEFDNLGFFLIPDGYNLNRAELDGDDPSTLDLRVFDDAGVWKVRDIDTGWVLNGALNPNTGASETYFTQPFRNPGDLDHTSITGGLATIGQEFQAWEDLRNLGDRDFNDIMFQLTLSCGLGVPGGDLLMGGDGNDTIFGNEEQDTLLGGAGDDDLRGNAGNDSLDGGEGDDVLRGGGGGDTLDGGAGSDTVHGGDGGDLILGGGSVEDDRYNGDGGSDTVSYEGETEDVLVDLGAGAASGAGIGNDALDSIENAVGGSGNDTLIGSDADNQLSGNDGDDLLSGTGGNDTLDGGAGNDTVGYETTTAGVTVDLGAGTASGPEIDTDSLADIENALGGSGDDSLSGSGAGNLLAGNAGDDTLDGGAGNDTLEGGDGEDLILSGDGDDLLTGGAGADTFLFDLWTGTDTITDFTPGGCGCSGEPSDKIDVSAFGFSNLFELGMLIEGAMDGTWIRLSEAGGGDVLLEDVLLFNLTSNDFIL